MTAILLSITVVLIFGALLAPPVSVSGTSCSLQRGWRALPSPHETASHAEECTMPHGYLCALFTSWDGNSAHFCLPVCATEMRASVFLWHWRNALTCVRRRNNPAGRVHALRPGSGRVQCLVCAGANGAHLAAVVSALAPARLGARLRTHGAFKSSSCPACSCSSERAIVNVCRQVLFVRAGRYCKPPRAKSL